MLEQMHQLAFYDAHTKLDNRRLLNDRLNQVMAASRRSGHHCPICWRVEHQCSASIGAVLFGNQEVSETDVLKRGDMAMYRANEEGSNLIRFHEENDKSLLTT